MAILLAAELPDAVVRHAEELLAIQPDLAGDLRRLAIDAGP